MRDWILAHQRTASLIAGVAVGVAMFVIYGGFARGWGTPLAAAALGFGVWIGMTLFLRFFSTPPSP